MVTGKAIIKKFLTGRWLTLFHRHRLTAKLLQDLINGPWEGDHPTSPHRTFNKYVACFTGFSPDGEVDGSILAEEPEVSLSPSIGFPFEKILESMRFFAIWRHDSPSTLVPDLLEDLARGMYTYMTQGEWPASSAWKELITLGIAWHKDGDQDALIDEPLALKSLLSWLRNQGKTLEHDIRSHFDCDRGLAWE